MRARQGAQQRIVVEFQGGARGLPGAQTRTPCRLLAVRRCTRTSASLPIGGCRPSHAPAAGKACGPSTARHRARTFRTAPAASCRSWNRRRHVAGQSAASAAHPAAPPSRLRESACAGWSRCAGTLAIFETEGGGIADVAHQLQGGVEIRIAFAGEADNEIGCHGDVGPAGADALHQAAIIVARMLTVIASSTASLPDCTGRCR